MSWANKLFEDWYFEYQGLKVCHVLHRIWILKSAFILLLMTSYYGAYFKHVYKDVINKCDFDIFTSLLGSLHIMKSHAVCTPNFVTMWRALKIAVCFSPCIRK